MKQHASRVQRHSGILAQYRGTAGAQVFTAGARAPAGPPLGAATVRPTIMFRTVTCLSHSCSSLLSAVGLL